MKWQRTLVLGAAVLTALHGCSGDPELYLGGPAGPAAAFEVSASRVDLAAGQTTTIGIRVVDAAGNVVEGLTPTATSGNAGVAAVTITDGTGQWTATATIAAQGLGQSAVTLSAGGLTTDIVARVGPAAYTLVGPASVASGESADYEVEVWDMAGNPLTVPSDFPAPILTSTAVARVTVEQTGPLTWTARGAAPGAVDVLLATDQQNELYGPYASERRTLTVVPGTFLGTLSAPSAAPGALVTATRAAGGAPFDADSKVRLGSTAAYVDRYTADNITFAVPAIGSTAAATLTLLDMGANQLAQTIPFTTTKASADVYSPGNISDNCAPPTTPVDWATSASPTGRLYLVHNGTGQGARGCFNGGAGFDHWIVYTTGASAETVDILAEWTLAGDNDIYVYSTDFSETACEGFSGSTTGELNCAGTDLSASTSYYIIFSPWTANAGNNQVRITVR